MGLTIDQITQFISTIGFPIAITLYLLYERRKDFKEHMSKNTEAIDSLKDAIEKLCLKIDD